MITFYGTMQFSDATYYLTKSKHYRYTNDMLYTRCSVLRFMDQTQNCIYFLQIHPTIPNRSKTIHNTSKGNFKYTDEDNKALKTKQMQSFNTELETLDNRNGEHLKSLNTQIGDEMKNLGMLKKQNGDLQEDDEYVKARQEYTVSVESETNEIQEVQLQHREDKSSESDQLKLATLGEQVKTMTEQLTTRAEEIEQLKLEREHLILR